MIRIYRHHYCYYAHKRYEDALHLDFCRRFPDTKLRLDEITLILINIIIINDTNTHRYEDALHMDLRRGLSNAKLRLDEITLERDQFKASAYVMEHR